MKERLKAPELRFPGFTDDWEERKWIDTVDMSTNMVNPKTGDYDDLLHIGPGNIESFTGRILDNVNTVKNDNLISGKFHFNPNDIIYGKINPQLAKYVHVDFEGLASADAYVLNSKNGVNQGFLFVELQTSGFYKYSVSVSMRTGMPKINRDELNQFSYLAPKNIEEQQRIGSFFKQLDNTITLHQRKLDLLKEQKKGYLQKMFPKNGAKVPELRFAGFADDWEERKLGDISYKVKEKNKTGEFTETLTNSAEYGIINQRDFFDKDISNAKNLTGYYVVKNDDFVYNPRISNFAPVGPIKRNKLGRTGVMSPLYYVFRTHDIDKNYFEKYFDTVYWHRFMELNGDSGARADRFAIKDSVFVEMPIPYPTMDEQQKIGSFFQQLDNTITLHQLKLDLLKEQKKGFLQKMFA